MSEMKKPSSEHEKKDEADKVKLDADDIIFLTMVIVCLISAVSATICMWIMFPVSRIWILGFIILVSISMFSPSSLLFKHHIPRVCGDDPAQGTHRGLS